MSKRTLDYNNMSAKARLKTLSRLKVLVRDGLGGGVELDRLMGYPFYL